MTEARRIRGRTLPGWRRKLGNIEHDRRIHRPIEHGRLVILILAIARRGEVYEQLRRRLE